MSNTEAFGRAFANDPTAIDDRHERGCIFRYGAIPELGCEAYDHPEKCRCHYRLLDHGVIRLPVGTFRMERTVSLPASLWWRLKKLLRKLLAFAATLTAARAQEDKS